MYLKLICAFFVTIPEDTVVNALFPINVLQRLSSYAIRCADVMGIMLPYSRGFASCLRGVSRHNDMAPLNARAFEDVWMWRIALRLSYDDISWMNIPINQPLLHRYHKGEDDISPSSCIISAPCGVC